MTKPQESPFRDLFYHCFTSAKIPNRTATPALHVYPGRSRVSSWFQHQFNAHVSISSMQKFSLSEFTILENISRLFHRRTQGKRQFDKCSFRASSRLRLRLRLRRARRTSLLEADWTSNSPTRPRKWRGRVVRRGGRRFFYFFDQCSAPCPPGLPAEQQPVREGPDSLVQ